MVDNGINKCGWSVVNRELPVWTEWRLLGVGHGGVRAPLRCSGRSDSGDWTLTCEVSGMP